MLQRWLDVARLRLRSVTRSSDVDAELDRELRAHLEQDVEANIARGMSPEDARFEARRAFGNVESVREEARDTRGTTIIDNLGRDLRYALRGLKRQPMLLLAATLSIALGAGGNIAVFSLASELLLAPPDVREPRDLVAIEVSHGSHATWQRYTDLRASDLLEGLAGYSVSRQLNWFNGDASLSITPMLVTANFFDVTGVPLARGRAFSSDEAAVERDPRVVVVSHGFWQRELSGDPAVVGRSIVLNGESYVVLGVLVPRLRSVLGFGVSPSVYVPFNRALVPDLHTRDAQVVRLIGRLKPAQSLQQGRVAIDAADRRLGRLAGDTVYAGVQEFSKAGGLEGGKAFRLVGGFFVLLGLVAVFVLFIACANVAGLLIARGAARRQEIAVRLALGGSRSRLLQQFLAEGFWLALFGTVFGMGLALLFMQVVNTLTIPTTLPIELHLVPDPALVLYALALVVVSMLLCALLPALGATRLTLTPALKREEPQYGHRRLTTRNVLLAGQVMMSTLLLVTAFLFVRNLSQTRVTNPGFETDRGLSALIGFVRTVNGGDDHRQLLASAVERVEGLPGVERASFASGVPLTMTSGISSNGRTLFVDGKAPGRHVEYALSRVGPQYFATLGIPLLQGREFASSDRGGAATAIVVNETFVRRYLEGVTPVGRVFRFEGDSALHEVVGVVADGKYITIGEDPRAAIYQPLLAQPGGLETAVVLVRTRAAPATLTSAVRQAIGGLDRSLAVEVQPLGAALSFALLPSRVGAAVLGTLGLLGLVLAMFGLYAIVSYNVSRRFSEIAIRVALGASGARIIRLVVRDALGLVGVGVALGIGVSAFVTQPLATFLVSGLSTTDPLSLAGTAMAFGVVSALASWLPARLATRVSPVIAMRLD